MTYTSNEDVSKFLESYDLQAKAIKKEALQMCWYMRGGLNYDQAMMLSNQERALIAAIIESNLETTNKTKLPFF